MKKIISFNQLKALVKEATKSVDDGLDYNAIVKKMRILKEEYGEKYIARLLSDTFGYEEVLQALDDAINED